MKKEQVILGVDPGTQVMGFAVVRVCGEQVELLQLNELVLSKYKDPYLRLKYIFERSTQLIAQYLPDVMALEAPFYGKNVQSMLKLGRAQGVAMAAALQREIPVTEYLPKKVKMAITGNGNASKEQVAKTLQQLLNIQQLPQKYDSTDALAVALCHHYNSGRVVVNSSSYGSWEAFVKGNNNKISGV